MKIKWIQPGKRVDVHELWIDKVDMGWVEPSWEHSKYRVSCMWMAPADDSRVTAGLLIATDYPEEHGFATIDEAKQALLESAIVMRLGGWKGRT